MTSGGTTRAFRSRACRGREPVPGFWATGIAWDLEGVQLEMNETLATISECRPTVTR